MGKHTVTLDPYSERLIRSIYGVLVKHGWPRASYSTALKVLLSLNFYLFLHIRRERIALDQATLDKVRLCLSGKRHMTDEDWGVFEEWIKELEKKGYLDP